MADNYLITGYWGEPHVTTENDRGINAAMFGTGRFVLPVGEEFAAELIGGNTVRMYDGKLMDNGAAAGIPVGEYVDLLIANAGQGMNRNDLIVFQYEQDSSTLIESGKFVVIQGAETTGTAADPVLTQKDLLSGKADFDQMALWRVSVSGATISAPVKVYELWERKAELTAADVGAVPTSRTVNGKALSSNITLAADDIGAVKKTGDTMTGALNVETSNSGGRAAHVSYSSNGYAVFLNRLDTNHSVGFRIYPNTTDALEALILTHTNGSGSGNSKNYKILHEGHKPSDSYTGNGSTATRKLTIGGIGGLLLIQGGGCTALVGRNGAIVLEISGTVSGLSESDIWFGDGVLTMNTDNEAVNGNSYRYNYQVL